MNNYDKKAEELLLKMAKREEEQYKKLLFSMYAIMTISMMFYFSTLLIAGCFLPEGPKQLIVIVISTIIFFISILIALKLEVDAGYYECKNCRHKFVPTYKEVLWAMHMGTTRYLKCPKCDKKSWSKKVVSK